MFRPGGGELRARGVIHAINAVLHPWLQQELDAILENLPQPSPISDECVTHAAWESWQQGLEIRITLPAVLPALRLLLIWDNLQGHWTPDLIG